MPKREPTPPPGDDEPNYFTILNPYPANADLELQGDMIHLVQWLAAAMGDEAALLAVFNKPSSPRLVIIEVSKSYRDVRHLLGQHFWRGAKGILNTPPTDSDNYSAIFFCHYTTGRQVEKHGWKRKWVENDMFNKVAREKLFKNPFPATTFLQVPATDPTAVEYCRPLPISLFPEVGMNKPKAIDPVGSATWADKKDQRPPTVNQKSTLLAKNETSTSFALDDAGSQETPESEPQNLWATSDDNVPLALMSDLAIASQSGINEQDRDICPHHGKLCKKMCEWRTNNEKKRGPKVGGPSNTKNYKPAGSSRGFKNQRPTLNLARSASSHNNSSPESANISPVALSPSTPGRGALNGKVPTRGRAPPPPPRVAHPVESSPVAQSAPEPAPTIVPVVAAGRGAASGPARGAPVWASRGRGRGRA